MTRRIGWFEGPVNAVDRLLEMGRTNKYIAEALHIPPEVVAARRRERFPKRRPAITPDRQLEIAMQALDHRTKEHPA